MRERLVAAFVVSLFFGLAACDGGGDPEGGGGTGGGNGGPCAGIERVCSTPDECPSLQTCSACGECVVDTGLRSCEDTSDCPIGRACRVPEGGTELRCVRLSCNQHSDCALGEACDTGRHACVPGDCVALGCPEGTYCREEDSTCVDCVGDIHCAGTDKPYCVEELSRCVVCEIDSDCPIGLRCSDYECVACATNADCAAPNRICRDDGMCVQCLSNADCPGVTCLESGRCDLGPIAGEACDPGRVCAPGFRCLGTGAGTCYQSCEPYDAECPAGQVCGFFNDGDGTIAVEAGAPAGICVRGVNGRTPGEVCGEAYPCRSDLLCLPADATTDRCRKPCDPAAPAGTVCNAGESCEALAIGTDGATIGFCMQPTTWGDPCGTDADCGAGLGCVPSTVQGDQLLALCEYTTGTRGPLASCDSDDDCRSGICLPYDGVPTLCWGACETDADCGTGTCGTWEFNLTGGGTATARGCRATCDNDADCAAYDGFLCGLGVDEELELFAECTAGGPGAGPGDLCTDDAQCALGICFSDGTATTAAEDGFCLGPCATDTDCGTGTFCRPAPILVSQNPVTYGVIDVCWGADCLADADCPTGRMCNFEPDPDNLGGAIRYSCAPAYGDLGAGEACATDLDCKSGICVDLGTAQICYGPCRTSADCGGGSYCWPEAFNYTTPNGTQVGIPGCIVF